MKTILKQLVLPGAASVLAVSLVYTAAMAAAAAIGANDLKIKSGAVQVDFLKETTATISEKFEGGSWGDNNDYMWNDGQAFFNQGGDLVKIALLNDFTTSRGVKPGMSASKMLALYPKPDKTEQLEDGPIYMFIGKVDGMTCVLGFAVDKKTNTVLYAAIQVNRDAGTVKKEEEGIMLQNPIGAYDGFLWSSTDQAEQLKVCKAITIKFNNAGYPGLMGEEQTVWWILTKFYKDNGGNHGEYQRGPVDIIIEKYRIKDKNVIRKLKAQ